MKYEHGLEQANSVTSGDKLHQSLPHAQYYNTTSGTTKRQSRKIIDPKPLPTTTESSHCQQSSRDSSRNSDPTNNALKLLRALIIQHIAQIGSTALLYSLLQDTCQTFEQAFNECYGQNKLLVKHMAIATTSHDKQLAAEKEAGQKRKEQLEKKVRELNVVRRQLE